MLIVLLMICMAASSNLHSTEPSRNPVMFVLDGSNSMWGQIRGKSKISIAKEVMTELISDWNADVPVGLMIYGHRRKDDCKDIELVAKPGKVDRKKLINKVQSIKPKGKTPITQSLIKAALAVNASKGNSSVVLVSDGLETCSTNPCASAFSFNLLNPGFDVHVIGFDVNEEESKALRCIADRSGGKFFRANNAKELQNALKKTVKVVTAKPVLKPKPQIPRPSLILNAKLCDACKHLTPLKVDWKIKGQDGKLLYDGLGELYPDDPKIKPGRYQAKVRYLSSVVVRDTELVIGEDGKQVGAVNLNGGSAVMFAYASDDKMLAAKPIHYHFYPITNGKAASKALDQSASSNAKNWLPAGRYRVVASHDQIKESAEIEVLAGKETRYEFDMRVGYFQPNAVLSPGGKPLGGFMDYRIYKTEKSARSGRSNGIFVLGAGNKKTPLRPGKYYVRAMLSYNRGSTSVVKVFPLEVKTNQLSKPVFDLQAGLLSHKVTSEAGNKIDNIDYIHERTGKRVSYYNFGGANTIALESGRYVLKILSGYKTHTSGAFDIVAGKTTSVEVKVP